MGCGEFHKRVTGRRTLALHFALEPILRNIGNADGGPLSMKRHPGFFRSMSLSKRALIQIGARALVVECFNNSPQRRTARPDCGPLELCAMTRHVCDVTPPHIACRLRRALQPDRCQRPALQAGCTRSSRTTIAHRPPGRPQGPVVLAPRARLDQAVSPHPSDARGPARAIRDDRRGSGGVLPEGRKRGAAGRHTFSTAPARRARPGGRGPKRCSQAILRRMACISTSENA